MFPGTLFNFSQYILDNVEEATAGVKGANSVKIFGRDIDQNETYADQVVDVMRTVPGIVDLGLFKSLGQPDVKITPDRSALARYGLNTGDVANVVQSALGGLTGNGSPIVEVYEGDKFFDLTVRWKEESIDPDFVISASLRQQMCRESPSIGFEPVMHLIADRRRHGRHGADDVAARRQRRQQGLVDLGDRGLQTRFDDAVKLDALPCRNPQRPVGPSAGDRVEAEILLRGQPPAGDADADHELPHLALATLLQFGGAVAVVTLVDAVKFEERIALFIERLRGVG